MSTFGVLVPAGTPQPMITRLNAELAKIVEMPEVKEQLLRQGVYALAPLDPTRRPSGCAPKCRAGQR